MNHDWYFRRQCFKSAEHKEKKTGVTGEETAWKRNRVKMEWNATSVCSRGPVFVWGYNGGGVFVPYLFCRQNGGKKKKKKKQH